MTTRVRVPFTEAFRTAVRQRDRGHGKPVDHVDEGRQPIVGRRSVVTGAISNEARQAVVARDIGDLFNTVNFAAGVDLTDHPEVRTSILNLGFPDLMNRTLDEHAVEDIGDEIAWVLSTYEPRLVTGSVRVARDRTVEAAELRIRFVVSADLDCNPLNLPVQFFADLERDTGRIVIQRR